MATPADRQANTLPTIVIVGRTNVGKSTLFNRLIEEKKALISDVHGTTRTRNEGEVLWRGKRIRLVDTGGLAFTEAVPLQGDIVRQTELALEEADVVLFLLDISVGITREEQDIARRLRRGRAPVFVVANKADSARDEDAVNDQSWYRLGLGEPFPVSAASGRNLGDLLDRVYTLLGKAKRRPKISKEIPEPIHVALLGKPNVGKSSLFNKLIGEDRVIVSDMAHTTREPYDTVVTYGHAEGKKKKKFVINFIDTAGIRRKAQVEGGLEREGIQKSLSAVERADIVVFVLDGSETISSQDMQLGGLLERRSKSVILVVNKWDLADDVSDRARNEVKKNVYGHFPHLSFAPILLVSGKTGYRVHDIFPQIVSAWAARHTQIPDDALHTFFKSILRAHRPARGKGTRQPEILGFRQIRTNPPIFELFIKQKTSLHMSYVHFIENRLREQFNFYAVPIVIKLTKMKR